MRSKIGGSSQSSESSHWTIGRLLSWTEKYFAEHGFPTPRLDAELLLAHALECRRLDLYTAYEKLVEPQERQRFRGLIARRAQREPIAYLTGEREFYSLTLEVTPAVLVPRPETEHLVDAALDLLCSTEPSAFEGEAQHSGGRYEEARGHVLDVGTGSGNIAVALATTARGIRVDAIDSSEAALEVARRNARRHGVEERVSFRRVDVLKEALGQDCRYDAILSNPPYIAASEFNGLMEDVRLHEPRNALLDPTGPERDGLGFYRVLASKSRTSLNSGGILAVEVGAKQAAEVCAIFSEAGYRRERIARDLAGIERIVVVRS